MTIRSSLLVSESRAEYVVVYYASVITSSKLDYETSLDGTLDILVDSPNLAQETDGTSQKLV